MLERDTCIENERKKNNEIRNFVLPFNWILSACIFCSPQKMCLILSNNYAFMLITIAHLIKRALIKREVHLFHYSGSVRLP